MFNSVMKTLFRFWFDSERGIMHLQEMESLGHTGVAGWLLAQERARLDYIAAKDAMIQRGAWRGLPTVWQRLWQLQSTNAIVQSLLNEHQMERLLARAKKANKSL